MEATPARMRVVDLHLLRQEESRSPPYLLVLLVLLVLCAVEILPDRTIAIESEWCYVPMSQLPTLVAHPAVAAVAASEAAYVIVLVAAVAAVAVAVAVAAVAVGVVAVGGVAVAAVAVPAVVYVSFDDARPTAARSL